VTGSQVGSESSPCASGTIVKGDYIGIGTASGDSASTYVPTQYVMVTANTTETENGGSAVNQYGVRIEPKLRETKSANVKVFHNPAKGLFRLAEKDVSWDADQISNFGITFNCIEVV